MRTTFIQDRATGLLQIVLRSETENEAMLLDLYERQNRAFCLRTGGSVTLVGAQGAESLSIIQTRICVGCTEKGE